MYVLQRRETNLALFQPGIKPYRCSQESSISVSIDYNSIWFLLTNFVHAKMSDYACTTHHCFALDARNEYRVKFRNKENIGNTHTGVTVRYLQMSSAMVLMVECHRFFSTTPQLTTVGFYGK
jgi:hypothetical protein